VKRCCVGSIPERFECPRLILFQLHAGLIRELGLWVLEQTCQDLKILHERGINVHMAVNRSINEFRTFANIRKWLPIVESYGLAPQPIVFEITESLLMSEKKSPRKSSLS
jgi:EAL domain-containing protein (putative c-di-GMP-specific phosphodiesterase class I)